MTRICASNTASEEIRYRLQVDIRHLDMPEAVPVPTMYFDKREDAVTMFRVLLLSRFLPTLHLFKNEEVMMKTENGTTITYPVE